jgi:hypothetical protein
MSGRVLSSESWGALRAALRAPRARFLQVLIVAVCVFAVAGPSFALAGAPITRVEEDWEIVIGEPNSDEISPQLYVVVTPNGSLDTKYAVFEINNLLLPDFYGGGLQFQTWYGDQAIGEAHHTNYNALSTSGETITFTVSMRLNEGNVQFEVLNGKSETWGDFGGSNSLKLSHSSSLSDLSAYDPEKSARWSRVGFGRGRVSKFALKKVRYYSNSSLEKTDETVRDALTDEPQ